MERTKTFEQFIDKFGGKEASEFEESFKNNSYAYFEDLNEKYYWFLNDNFDNLPEEEELKFTVEQAEKIRNNRFIRDYFDYITVSEMKINNENANEKLSELAKKIDSSSDSFVISLGNFLVYYFSNSYADSILSKFCFEYFSFLSIEFLIAHRNFFSFINDLLKQRYADFECKDFLLQIEQNPQNVFDYLTEKLDKEKNWKCNLMIYLYLHIKFEEQTPERFKKLSIEEKHFLIFSTDTSKLNITQRHVDLIPDACQKIKRNAQYILDSRNKKKVCEIIKLFLATLFSLVSIASIIIGVIALASLLTLPFSPWILVGVGLPVLAGGVYFFGKSVKKNFSSLSSMANESNVKEEKSDDNSVIPQKNDKSENNISKPEVQEEEEDKSEIDLNN